MYEMIWPRGHGNTCAKRTSTHINHSVLFYYSKSQLAASDPYKFFFFKQWSFRKDFYLWTGEYETAEL
jgi:hypothetical protein